MATFGHKKTEAQKEALREEADKFSLNQSSNPFLTNLAKTLQPHKYPMESAMAMYFIGDAFWTASGLSGNKGGMSKAHFAGGALNLASDINGLVAKESIQTFDNPHPKGSIPYMISEFQQLQHRPVLVSSLLNVAGDLSCIGLGVRKYLQTGKPDTSILTGSLLFLGNMIQAIYVDKNDYNIEENTGSASKYQTLSRHNPYPITPIWDI